MPMNKNYLSHHGVDGMKWGKRNGPPYPLNASGRADLRKQRKEALRKKDDDVKREYNKQREAVKSGRNTPNNDAYKKAAVNQAVTTIGKVYLRESDRAKMYENVQKGENFIKEAAKALLKTGLKDVGTVSAITIGATAVSTILAGPFAGAYIGQLVGVATNFAISGTRIASAVKQNMKDKKTDAAKIENKKTENLNSSTDKRLNNQRQLSTLSKSELGKRLQAKEKEINAAERDLKSSLKAAKESGDYSDYNYKVEKYQNIYDGYEDLKDMYNWK